MGWRELTVEQLLGLKNPLVIDVRSPCEHAAERLPDSINVPLLSDEERAVVGIIYKEVGEVVARRHALKLIAPKIPTLIDDIVALRTLHSQATVLYCWRGGLRSESVASLLSMAGIECFRLQGGYKSWRANVLRDFQTDQYRFVPLILHGLTGVGKTEILQELRSLDLHVLDLEKLACHRGSAFGSMGLAQQPSQKNFDALVWKQLREVDTNVVFMEAESRKIGRISLPDCIYSRILSGAPILITGTIEKRVERIISDYLSTSTPEQLEVALEHLADLKERLGLERVKHIKETVLSGDLHSAVKALLLEYYDPLYAKQIEKHSPFLLTVSGDNPSLAAGQIASWNQDSAAR
ncbi:MAG: tRNA 2-selenouridine(34) synthase MnmH [Candidatus Melainabacteria bacterium]|nr:tRNA 2-selenouridine(34) synthase MnmH [Candidatus Melainabacteria bacterium]